MPCRLAPYALPLLIAGAAVCLCACAGPAPPAAGVGAAPDGAWREQYAGATPAGARIYRIDEHASQVRIFAFRGGKAARFGHNHVLAVPRLEGFAMLPEAGAAAGAAMRCDLEFRLDQLQLDDPAQRAAAGLGGPIGVDDIVATREHMLGERGLQAAAYPTVHLQCLQAEGEAPRLALRLRTTLHGRVQDTWIPVQVEALPGSLVVRGGFVLHQSDFGLVPYSILGGLLSVQDALLVEFELRGS